MHFTHTVASIKGGRPYQEDFFSYAEKNGYLFAFVCDGHASPACSLFVKNLLASLFDKLQPFNNDFHDYLISFLTQVNLGWTIEADRLRTAKKKGWKEHSESGTTLSGIMIHLSSLQAAVFNIGDSSVVVTGPSKGIHFVTSTTSLKNPEVRQRINNKVGYICCVQDRSSSSKEGEWRIETRDGNEALNMCSSLGDLYCPGMTEALDRRMDINLIKIKAKSNILISTDGVGDVLDNKQVADLIHEGKTAQQIVDFADTKEKRDNATAILIRFA
jgi:serine/threonine protein phosphatase PrpC